MRTQYKTQEDERRLDRIRARLVGPVGHPDVRANANIGTLDISSKINTVVLLGGDLICVADCRWRARRYDPMELSLKNGYLPLANYTRGTGIPSLIVWGFGDQLECHVLVVNPDVTIDTSFNGRVGRSDPMDEETMARIPVRWLVTPEQLWQSSGLERSAFASK